MASSARDNGSAASMTEMPQWKRELIIRRRAAQQQASKDNAASPSATVNKQLSLGASSPCSSCCCCLSQATTISSTSTSETAKSLSVALGCGSPLGHQPNSNSRDCCASTSSATSSSSNCSKSGSGGVAVARSAVSCVCCRSGAISSCCDSPSSCSCSSPSSRPPPGGVAACGTPSTTCDTSPVKRRRTSGCCCSALARDEIRGARSCNCSGTCCSNKMVHLQNDSDSSEDLQYGPGIVNKLKNRYLSLTLRETTVKRRPSILMRKATSLENLLDDNSDYANDNLLTTKCNGQRADGNDEDAGAELLLLKQSADRLYESRTNGTNGNARNVPSSNRYHRSCSTPAGRGHMKRARSVEALSRIWSPGGPVAANNVENQQAPLAAKPETGRPKSLHEEINFAVNPIITPRVLKPKRITPVIMEKEKPPADVVKQTKRIFEARPESRTRPPQITGEVAAKVASYKTIIIQNKVSNKPPIKTKPMLNDENKNARQKHNIRLNLKTGQNNCTSPVQSPITPPNGSASPGNINKSLPSPIPDVSNVNEEDDERKWSHLSETPDLILHSSPIHVQKEVNGATPTTGDDDDDFIQPEVRHEEDVKPALLKPPTPPPPPPPPKTAPLTLDITSATTNHYHQQRTSPSANNNRDGSVLVLSPREIEKNAINAANSCPPLLQEQQQQQQQSPPIAPPKNVINTNVSAPPVPPPAKDLSLIDISDEQTPPPARPKPKARKSKQQAPQDNCIVFKFTHRTDVPDYIGNDGMVRTQRIEIPKAGEGGITLLPGATILDVNKDFEDDELLFLPPSPCDVNFINDNMLINGKSSLREKSKKTKGNIQFVEAIPQVFEYPSEASMLLDETQTLNQPLGGTTVPSLGGSTLANYTPKVGASDFQLGVTKSPAPPPPVAVSANTQETEETELEEPMLFSSGTNSDILF